MRKIIILFALTFFSVSLLADGKTIFNSKGCTACHQPSADSVGPSLKSISTSYKGQLGDLIKFLKGEGKPRLDKGKFAGQFETVMKLQLSQTKSLNANDLKQLAEFLLSH
ncbi:MAG: c-type cytochrome [Leptonema sp. (in: bacteria)]